MKDKTYILSIIWMFYLIFGPYILSIPLIKGNINLIEFFCIWLFPLIIILILLLIYGIYLNYKDFIK